MPLPKEDIALLLDIYECTVNIFDFILDKKDKNVFLNMDWRLN